MGEGSNELVKPDFIDYKPWKDGVPSGGLITPKPIPEGQMEMRCEQLEPGIDKIIGVNSPRKISARIISADTQHTEKLLKLLRIEVLLDGVTHRGVPKVVEGVDENGQNVKKIHYDLWTSEHRTKKPGPLILDRLKADKIVFRRSRVDKFTTNAA